VANPRIEKCDDAGYKWKLMEDFQFAMPLLGCSVYSRYIELDGGGIVTIKKGYRWDGASGPTIDTPNVRTPSMVHDAFYQLIRTRRIPYEWKTYADNTLFIMLQEDQTDWEGNYIKGMGGFRARIWKMGVMMFGGFNL